MEVKTKFVTKDGEEFDTREEAYAHEKRVEEMNEDRYLKFINHTYSGMHLYQKYDPNEFGFWHVHGEGHGEMTSGPGPDMGIYKGRLIDVVRKVTGMNEFWNWGYGGSIDKVTVTEV